MTPSENLTPVLACDGKEKDDESDMVIVPGPGRGGGSEYPDSGSDLKVGPIGEV